MAILKMRGTSFSVLEMESAVAHSDVVLKSLEDLTPLRAARAVTLLGWLSRHRLLLLTAQNFEKFEKNGWSRKALEQTTDDLASAGLAKLVAFPDCVCVEVNNKLYPAASVALKEAA
jgi:hypothetical protein